MTNDELADALDRLATLLDASGASAFAVRAYRRGARRVREAPLDVAALVAAGRARELAGIGASIDTRLRELVATGRIAELEELEASLGPELVRRATRRRRPPRGGLLLHRALAVQEELAATLGGISAGDPRRGVDEPERLAVVVRDGAVLERLEQAPGVVAVTGRAPDRALAVTSDGVAVEVLAAPRGRLGATLVEATGAADWVSRLGPLPDGDDERAVLEATATGWVAPELRETSAPATRGRLLERADVTGDLHVHTTWSDGRASVLEMAEAADALGHAYLAVCDHTRAVRVVPGLDADDLRRQGEEIAAANERLAPFRVLRGVECDILDDGSLDLPDDVLAELDWVQISLHAGQRKPRDELTRRVAEAMRHPAARCLSHPKGRILGHRPENALDLDEIFAVALETGVALEVNGLPDRLDLSGRHVADAVAAGVEIVCSTDAHSARGLGLIDLAVATARRGGAPRDAVVNTRPLEEVLATRRSSTRPRPARRSPTR
jgi:DNA polymerase (family 10)